MNTLNYLSYIVIAGLGILFGAGFLLMFFSIANADRGRLKAVRRPKRLAGFSKKAIDLAYEIKNIRKRALTQKKKAAAQREIFAALGVLRNHSRAAAGGGMTTDALIEKFSADDTPLKDVWAICLRLLRVGREKEIPDFFAAAVGGGLARDFIMLLLEWDRIPPARLTETIASFQTAMKETRTTEITRKNEVLSDIVYLPVIACVLVVFMNFIYVAYFVEQKELLGELFF